MPRRTIQGCSTRSMDQPGKRTALRGYRDQGGQSLEARLVPLRAENEPGHELAIRRRLRRKKLGGAPIGSKGLPVWLRELGRACRELRRAYQARLAYRDKKVLGFAL